MKVKLRKYTRMFESDDTSFQIQGTQILELPEKFIRSYSIKHALFHGLLKIVEGGKIGFYRYWKNTNVKHTLTLS